MPKTFFAPAFLSTLAHSRSVVPVVETSSMSQMDFPWIRRAPSLVTSNALRRLWSLSSFVSVLICGLVKRVRMRQFSRRSVFKFGVISSMSACAKSVD